MPASRNQIANRMPALDPRFAWILGLLWKTLKTIYNSIKFIFSLIFSYVKKERHLTEPPKPTLPENVYRTRPIKPLPKFTDEKTFMQLGTLRWIQDLTPRALIDFSIKHSQDIEELKISYLKNNKEEKSFNVVVFGDLYEEEVTNIKNILTEYCKEKSPDTLKLQQVHIIKDLGKFLNESGAPDIKIPAFTIDQFGAMLLHEEAALDDKRCKAILRFAIQEYENYHSSSTKSHKALWNIAQSIEERLISNYEYSAADTRYRYGRLRGRFVIDSDSQIEGGVYLGLPAREALLADCNGPIISNLFNTLVKDIKKSKEALGLPLEEKILSMIYEISQKALPRSTPEALKSMRLTCRIVGDEEMQLEECLKYETGDADHQALLIALFIDKLHKEHEHYMCGKVSIERNWLPGGGHTWVRYTHSENDIYIIDPKKSYFGRLDDYTTSRWPYERAEDLKKQRIARPIK
jgi:hypothetical protein